MSFHASQCVENEGRTKHSLVFILSYDSTAGRFTPQHVSHHTVKVKRDLINLLAAYRKLAYCSLLLNIAGGGSVQCPQSGLPSSTKQMLAQTPIKQNPSIIWANTEYLCNMFNEDWQLNVAFDRLVHKRVQTSIKNQPDPAFLDTDQAGQRWKEPTNQRQKGQSAH